MPADGGNGGPKLPAAEIKGSSGTALLHTDAERLAVVEARLQSLSRKLAEKPSGLKRLRERLSVIVAVAATGFAGLGYWNSQVSEARATAAEERSAAADRRDRAADDRAREALALQTELALQPILSEIVDTLGGQENSSFWTPLEGADRGRKIEKLSRLLERAEAIAPMDSRVMLSRGCYWVVRMDDEEALAVYDRVLEIDPEDAAGHIARGVTLKRLGRPEEALAAYDAMTLATSMS